MGLIGPLVFLVLANGTSVALSRRDFGHCLPITLMGGGLVLYSSALVFGNFEPGFCFLLLWAASFPVIYTVKLVHFRNDHQSSFWLNQRFCTPGLLIFVTTYVGVYLYDLNRSFTNWDEFSHWGVMIKEMLRLNTFYSVDSSVLAVHKDYPPAIQIIEWLWCRLSGGCYEEAYLYRALHIFILSFAFPVVDTIIRHRSKLQWRIIVGFMAVVLFFILCLSEPTGSQYFTTVYIDPAFGVLGAWCIFLALKEDYRHGVGATFIGISIAFIVLSKQMGIFFWGLVVLVLIARWSMHVKKGVYSTRRKAVQGFIFISIGVGVFPVFAYVSWNSYIQALAVESQFHVSLSQLFQMPGIAAGSGGETWQHLAMSNFISAVLSTPIVAHPIQLSYFQLMTLITLGLLLLLMSKKADRRRLLFLVILIASGSILYAFVMMFLYTFSFGSYEGPSLASYSRYMGTYVITTYVLIYYSVLTWLFKRSCSQAKLAYVFMCALLAAVVVLPPDSLLRAKPALFAQDVRATQLEANKIAGSLDSGDSVFVVSQNNTGDAVWEIAYYINPHLTNADGINYNFCFGPSDEWYWNVDTDIEGFSGRIAGYDYMYLHNVDTYFIETYHALFDDVSSIRKGALYEVKHEKSSIVLHEIACSS